EWPYNIAEYTVQPPPPCYKDAYPDRIHSYYRIPVNSGAITLIRHALSLKLPVLMGFVVYPSFESAYTAETGIVTLPTMAEKPLGGHAVLIAGADETTKHVIVRNSWGSGWGLSGYCLFPYDYITNHNLVMDLWVIQNF
ncbi:MAG: C1 family peptidase, partial [Sulfobacillus sp.]